MCECESEIDDDDLKQFGLMHYTFINQIFGDRTVREIIEEVYPSTKFKFKVDANRDHGYHHVLLDKTGKKICSINDGYQDIDVNVNDTLCQSYSIMNYLGISFPKTRYTQYKKDEFYEQQTIRQITMIKMYRDVISNPLFRRKFNGLYYTHWRDYTKSIRGKFKFDKNLTCNQLLKIVQKTLDDWQSYGYRYYIGSGTSLETQHLCHKNAKIV